MRTVGVRELRQRASELLRLVERGESFEVTDRNRPVARLVPRPVGSGFERLLDDGEITVHSKSLDELPPPLKLSTRPSRMLRKLRANER